MAGTRTTQTMKGYITSYSVRSASLSLSASGTIMSTDYGVAKRATAVDVRVIDANDRVSVE